MSAQRRRYVVHQHDVAGEYRDSPSSMMPSFTSSSQSGPDHVRSGSPDEIFRPPRVAFALEGFGVFFFLTDQVRIILFTRLYISELSSAGPEMIAVYELHRSGWSPLRPPAHSAFTLYTFFRAERHVIAQVVKAYSLFVP